MKTRSARLEEPYVFFIDRCLGKRSVPQLVEAALAPEERTEIHDDHFAQNVKDTEWLSAVGARGWVVLSQDKAIVRNPLELRALLGAGVAFFGVGSGSMPGTDIGSGLARGLPGIRRALRRFGLPMIATVSLEGDVTVKWVDGKRLKTPVRLAGKRRRKGHG